MGEIDLYMQMEGILGESLDVDHRDWIELLAYRHLVRQNIQVEEETGQLRAAGCEHSKFVVRKRIDRASPKIYEICSRGAPLKKVAVELCRPAALRARFLRIDMDDVFISSVRPTASEESFPTELLGLRYSRIRWTYTQLKTDGSVAGSTSSSWDTTDRETVPTEPAEEDEIA